MVSCRLQQVLLVLLVHGLSMVWCQATLPHLQQPRYIHGNVHAFIRLLSLLSLDWRLGLQAYSVRMPTCSCDGLQDDECMSQTTLAAAILVAMFTAKWHIRLQVQLQLCTVVMLFVELCVRPLPTAKVVWPSCCISQLLITFLKFTVTCFDVSDLMSLHFVNALMDWNRIYLN